MIDNIFNGYFWYIAKTAGSAEKSKAFCENLAKSLSSEEELPVWCHQHLTLVRQLTAKRLAKN
jgi:hypothetical protein